MASRYDEDIVLWSQEQARALRAGLDAGWNAPIDWEHVAEEIESLGLSEWRALASHLRNIIEHLMKLQASPAKQPVRLWRDTVRRARLEIAPLLATSPSLRREVSGLVAEATKAARILVRDNLEDYGEQPRIDLQILTYTADQVLGDWMPPRG